MPSEGEIMFPENSHYLEERRIEMERQQRISTVEIAIVLLAVMSIIVWIMMGPVQ